MRRKTDEECEDVIDWPLLTCTYHHSGIFLLYISTNKSVGITIVEKLRQAIIGDSSD